MISVGVRAPAEKTYSLWPQKDLTLREAFLSTTNVVFAYGTSISISSLSLIPRYPPIHRFPFPAQTQILTNFPLPSRPHRLLHLHLRAAHPGRLPQIPRHPPNHRNLPLPPLLHPHLHLHGVIHILSRAPLRRASRFQNRFRNRHSHDRDRRRDLWACLCQVYFSSVVCRDDTCGNEDEEGIGSLVGDYGGCVGRGLDCRGECAWV